jgi:hypothetical protein
MSKKTKIISTVVSVVLVAAVGLFASYNIILLADVYRPMNFKADPSDVFSSVGLGFAGLSNGYVSVSYDLSAGRYNVAYNGNALTMGAYSQADVRNESGRKTLYKSKDYPLGEVVVKDISDGFGNGKSLSVERILTQSTAMIQTFYVYDGAEYLITDLKISSTDEISTNDMRQILSEKDGGARTVLGNMKKLSILETPFDNNEYEEFSPRPLSDPYYETVYGYGFSMLFSEAEREALVVGALDNSVFKNALVAKRSLNLFKKAALDSLYMHFGKLSYESRDYNNQNRTENTTEHGYISGKTLSSPRMFYGYFRDYRDGLEAFGDAAGTAEQALRWEGNVPVGYNSWAALGFGMNYGTMTEMSDYIAENLPTYGENTDVYLNFDSGFDRLSLEERAAFPTYARANGQKAGAYWTPFTIWGGSDVLDRTLTDYFGNPIADDDGNELKNRDIVLRDKTGQPISYGGYTIDLTHPAAFKKLDSFLEAILDWGYSYFKMDFINDGSMEGEHYDKSIAPTGLAAFNYGMRHIREYIENYTEQNNRDPFFINAAISPIFSGQNLHSRRISCDVFEKIHHTEYLLNSLTYGWWMNGRIISVADPDHLVMYRYFDSEDPAADQNEANAAAVSRIIGGTLLMWSDNLAYPEARDRAESVLQNRGLMELAAKNQAFRPLNSGRSSEVFYLADGETLYVALFNFDRIRPKIFSLSPSEFGFDGTTFSIADMLSNASNKQSNGRISATLPPSSGTILKVSKV